MSNPNSDAPIPVAVLTGALGSGKTTFIRDLMRRPEMAGTALIVNEFGEVGLDHLLVSSSVETTLLMENGCMCCSLRGDLVDTVLDLFASVARGEIARFSRILVETTGLADPVPIVRDLTTSPALAGKVRLSSVATCVDGLLGAAALGGDPVAQSQIAQADLILVSKTDLADRANIDALTERLSVMNPLARIVELQPGVALPDDPLFGSSPIQHLRPAASHSDAHGAGHHHGHDGVETLSIVREEPLPWDSLRDWLDLVYSLHAAHMLRMKGFLWVTERDGPVLVQGVGPVVSPVSVLDTWPEGRRLTRLVMISRGLSAAALQRSFEAGPGSETAAVDMRSSGLAGARGSA